MKQQALDHYDRMIAWAETQNPQKKPNRKLMYKEIGDKWDCLSCVYCLKYGDNSSCGSCPLYIGSKCCNGLWTSMSLCRSWDTWLKNARKVREYIRING